MAIAEWPPEGLTGFLQQDIPAAEQRLKTEPASFRQAVVDGNLADHEPTFGIVTTWSSLIRRNWARLTIAQRGVDHGD